MSQIFSDYLKLLKIICLLLKNVIIFLLKLTKIFIKFLIEILLITESELLNEKSHFGLKKRFKENEY